MPPLRALFHPTYPWRFLKSRALRCWLDSFPNHRGACRFPPGHFYSPLLDLAGVKPGTEALLNDGEECWEHVELHPDQQRDLYAELLAQNPRLTFPGQAQPGWRYHWKNDWFPLADAFLLSGLMRREKPQRIIEVGSGFSTAVMLDTLEQTGGQCDITCIEPFPQRLEQLLGVQDMGRITLHRQSVQSMPLEIFDTLEAGDFLFIDSSHVAKAGSDVAFLFLRVIPRLKPGVWVHVHDMFYPGSYPMAWFQEGRAWNESLFLRALLIGNSELKVRAFNQYAAAQFPGLFTDSLPAMLANAGGSFWMQRA